MTHVDCAPPSPSGGIRPSEGCPGADEVLRALVERLRARRHDLAAAVSGHALSIEIVLEPARGEPHRLGFAGEGYVTTLSPASPLTLGFSPDVVIQGTPHEVLDVLSAREPTQEGVRLSHPNAWPRFARVQRVVASELRALL